MAMIYVIGIAQADAATEGLWNQITYLHLNVQLAESVAREALNAHYYMPPEPWPPTRWHMRGYVVDPNEPGENERPWFEDRELDQDAPPPLPREPWRATAIVYNLQATPDRVTLWVNAWDSPEDIANAVSLQLFATDDDRFVFPTSARRLPTLCLLCNLDTCYGLCPRLSNSGYTAKTLCHLP